MIPDIVSKVEIAEKCFTFIEVIILV